MFTDIKKGKWSYMFLAAAAVLALAALVTLFNNLGQTDTQERANQEDQFLTGSYSLYNESSIRFIN